MIVTFILYGVFLALVSTTILIVAVPGLLATSKYCQSEYLCLQGIRSIPSWYQAIWI